ncbi:hypothetical protein [Priestia sp. YIM B13489]
MSVNTCCSFRSGCSKSRLLGILLIISARCSYKTDGSSSSSSASLN